MKKMNIALAIITIISILISFYLYRQKTRVLYNDKNDPFIYTNYHYDNDDIWLSHFKEKSVDCNIPN